MPAIVRSPVTTTAARLLLALALVAGVQAAFAGAAFAVEPENDGSTGAISLPVREPVKGGGEAPQAKPGGGTSTRGFDISYPQCGGPYPSNSAFGIVGVNGGRVFSVNPCLASQIVWGGGVATELYANTGNPGPALSSFWPTGQTTPRFCDPNDSDTADCAFDYGWNAARHSFEAAEAAYRQLGITTSPSATAWWLDVETSNSWREDNLALNVAALEGEVEYLLARGVTRLGFYSTTFQWGLITGGTKVFDAYPSWGAGARNERGARNLCQSTTTSFTGAALVLVQYPYQGFDANVRC